MTSDSLTNLSMDSNDSPPNAATEKASFSVLTVLLSDDLMSKNNHQSLARLLPQVALKEFAAGETIYEADTKADHVYVMISGTVELISRQGRRATVARGCFGEEAGADVANYVSTAVTTSSVQALSIPRAAMKVLASANAKLKTDLLFSLSGHFSGEQLAAKAKSVAPAEKVKGQKKEVNKSIVIGWMLCLILPLLTLEYSEAMGLANSGAVFLAIFSATVTMWVFGLVDDYIPGLFALLATLVTGLVPAPVILSGFASDGFLMALSTLALGTVVVTSGLSYRFMLTLLRRLPNTQFWHCFGLFMTGSILTAIIPTANGRIALVGAFYADMVESLQLKAKGLAATRLAIVCFGGISLFSAVFITSKSVNFAVFGLLSAQGQDHFQWLTWFLAAIVVGGVMLLINALGLMFWFRNKEIPRLPRETISDQLTLLGEIKQREWAAIAGVAFMIVGIITSSIHKVQPPWLGFTMLFGLLMCGTLNKKELKEKVDWTFLLYLSGITGIVAAFNYLGLDKELGSALPLLGGVMRTDFSLFVLLLFVLINVIRLAVPINATVVVVATILMPLAEINGVNGWVVGFLILVFAEGWFLPYQCSYYLQMQELNAEREVYDERSFLIFNAVMNLSKLAAVYASVPYWKMLGILS
jgi:divalent anion:Na+ symporter, DASS family